MKMKNTFKSCLLCLSFILTLLTSCNNIVDNSSSETKKADGDVAYITLGSSTKFSRDIFPCDADLDKTQLTNISLYGTWAPGTLNARAQTFLTNAANWATATESDFELQTGFWNFSLSGTMNGETFSGTLENQEITSGTTAINFTLTTSYEYGGLALTVVIPNASSDDISSGTILTVDYSLLNSSGIEKAYGSADYDCSEDYVTFTRSMSDSAERLEAGVYSLTIHITADEITETLNTYEDKLHITAGIITTKTINMRANSVYDIGYKFVNDSLVASSESGPAVYTRKTADITLPDTVTKTGYTFVGWFIDKEDSTTPVETIPKGTTGPKTYYARFTPNPDTPYVVKHWKQKLNAGNVHNDTNYELDETNDVENLTGITDAYASVSAKDTTAGSFLGFIAPSASELAAANQETILPSGLLEINLYYDRQSYSVTYTDGQGNTISGLGGTYLFDATVDVDFTTPPTRTAYDFAGWKAGGVTYTSTGTTSFTMGAADVELVSQWTSHPYLVTLHYNGGTFNGNSEFSITLDVDCQVGDDNCFDPGDYEPSRTNFTFGGWYTDEELTEAFTGSEINLSHPTNNPEDFHDWNLYAKWNAPSGFVFVKGATIEGAIEGSSQFVSGSSKTIVDMLVSDHEVTQGEYETYCMYGQASTYQPSSFDGLGDNYAVYGTNWYDAIVYCNLRSRAENLTPVYAISGETDPTQWSGIQKDDPDTPTKYCGPDSSTTAWNNITVNNLADGYRLPTSAEWEYAARNGNNGIPEPYYDYAFSSSSDTLADIAWYSANSGSKVHEVKTDKTSGKDSANALGIYDMCGNVNEWCWDKEAGSSTMRTLRGGHCTCSDTDEYNQLNISDEGHNYPYQRIGKGGGFRVVRTVFSSEYLGSKPAPTEVGDIVFTDGSAVPYSSGLVLDTNHQNAAIAVIFYVGNGLNNSGDTSTRILGFGLKVSSTASAWASGIALYHYSETFDVNYDENSGCNTIFADVSYKNGTNLFNELKVDYSTKYPDATLDFDDASKYSHFYFAINYKENDTKLAGTDFEDGWYLPTICELVAAGKAYKNNSLGNAIDACGGDQISSRGFWASTVTNLNNGNKMYYKFNASTGDLSSVAPSSLYYSCAIRQFN